MKIINILSFPKNNEPCFRLIISFSLLNILALSSCLLFAQDDGQIAFANAGKNNNVANEAGYNMTGKFYPEDGTKKMNSIELKHARRYYNRAIANDAYNADLYSKQGQLYARSNDYRRAIENFNQAIELDGKNAEFYYYRALAKTYIEKTESSILDCDIAIRLNPEYAEAYLVRGISKALIGETDGSMEDLKKAIALRCDYAEAFYNIGLNYYELRDDASAKIYFKKASDLGFQIPQLEAYLKK